MLHTLYIVCTRFQRLHDILASKTFHELCSKSYLPQDASLRFRYVPHEVPQKLTFSVQFAVLFSSRRQIPILALGGYFSLSGSPIAPRDFLWLGCAQIFRPSSDDFLLVAISERLLVLDLQLTSCANKSHLGYPLKQSV